MVRIIIILIILNNSILLSQENVSPGSDTVTIGEIVIESNRLKMTKMLAPNKIQTFDENFISSLNGGRLSDLLGAGDALFIKDYGFNSGVKTISLNSTQSEHTLILLNGIRLNSRQNAQFDLSLYDLDNVSNVEISKGGSSALYGSEAIGGVVNLITKNVNQTKPFSFQFKSNFGSYGLRKFYGNISHRLNDVINYTVSYSDERAKNNFEYYFKNGLNKVLKERENSDYNTQTFNFDVNYLKSKKTYLKLFAYYSHFSRGVPGVEIGYSAGTARQIDYNAIASLQFYKEYSKKINIKSDISYKYSLQKYFDPSTFNLAVIINSFYKLNSYINSSSVNYSPANNFSLVTGYEISYNNILSDEIEEGKLIQGALFAAGSYALTSIPIYKISVYPSIRYDYFSNIEQKNVITGKLGLNLKPFEKIDVSIKSSIGNNFSAPTFNELYWKDLGNKNLKPERSICFDAGLFYRFNFIFLNELEFSYYNISTKDRIVWTPVSGSIWRPINIGKVKSEGIDISINSALGPSKYFKISAGFDYSYGSAIKKNEDFPGDPSYNKQLLYIPQEMVKSSFKFNYLPTSKLIKFVSFNLFFSYNTRKYINVENIAFVPKYYVFDANAGVGFKFFKSEVFIKYIINNILNKDYQVISGYPMPLRNFKLEINIKY